MKLLSRLVDRQIDAYQRELIDTHYQEVENMYRQMRGWRHDYRNHIQTLKVLADEGDLDGIRAYLDQLDTDLNTVDLAVKTGNRHGRRHPQQQNLPGPGRGTSPRRWTRISPSSSACPSWTCAVFSGNLFDNAIEASLALPEDQRLIRVYMDMKGTQLYISFTNFTAVKKQAKTGGRFHSTKGAGHGFGLGAHRRHRPAAGRLPQPQQRGRRLHHRDSDSADMTQAKCRLSNRV